MSSSKATTARAALCQPKARRKAVMGTSGTPDSFLRVAATQKAVGNQSLRLMEEFFLTLTHF